MPLLEVRNVFKNFGGLTAIKGVSFNVEAGEILGLIGPNGSGKTTMFNLISSIHRPSRGEIFFKGEPTTKLKPYQVCHQGIGRTFQITKPFARMTVLENAMVGAIYGQKTNASLEEARKQALAVIDLVGLSGKRDTPVTELTLPFKKRLELSKALSTKPELLLLDEVMAGLNPAEIDGMIPLIKNIQAGGVTVVIVEHVMRAVMGLAHRIVVMNYGEKIAEGTPRTIADDPKVIQAYLGQEYRLAKS